MPRISAIERLYAPKLKNIFGFDYDSLSAPPIMSVFSPEDIAGLIKIATSIRYNARIKKKYELIDNIMERRGFKRKYAGTNRLVYEFLDCPTVIAKVAIDRVGMRDSPAEYRNQQYLKPFCCKIFEVDSSGVIAFVEKVHPITSLEEFISVSDDVFNMMITKVIGKYVVDDMGAQYYMNYGVRLNSNGHTFGPVVLDYPYLYKLDGKKLTCKNPINTPTGQEICNGQIDYDAKLTHLICKKCGKEYTALDLALNEIEKENIDLYCDLEERNISMATNIMGSNGEIYYGTGVNSRTTVNTNEMQGVNPLSHPDVVEVDNTFFDRRQTIMGERERMFNQQNNGYPYQQQQPVQNMNVPGYAKQMYANMRRQMNMPEEENNSSGGDQSYVSYEVLSNTAAKKYEEQQRQTQQQQTPQQSVSSEFIDAARTPENDDLKSIVTKTSEDILYYLDLLNSVSDERFKRIESLIDSLSQMVDNISKMMSNLSSMISSESSMTSSLSSAFHTMRSTNAGEYSNLTSKLLNIESVIGQISSRVQNMESYVFKTVDSGYNDQSQKDPYHNRFLDCDAKVNDLPVQIPNDNNQIIKNIPSVNNADALNNLFGMGVNYYNNEVNPYEQYANNLMNKKVEQAETEEPKTEEVPEAITDNSQDVRDIMEDLSADNTNTVEETTTPEEVPTDNIPQEETSEEDEDSNEEVSEENEEETIPEVITPDQTTQEAEVVEVVPQRTVLDKTTSKILDFINCINNPKFLDSVHSAIDTARIATEHCLDTNLISKIQPAIDLYTNDINDDYNEVTESLYMICMTRNLKQLKAFDNAITVRRVALSDAINYNTSEEAKVINDIFLARELEDDEDEEDSTSATPVEEVKPVDSMKPIEVSQPLPEVKQIAEQKPVVSSVSSSYNPNLYIPKSGYVTYEVDRILQDSITKDQVNRPMSRKQAHRYNNHHGKKNKR